MQYVQADSENRIGLKEVRMDMRTAIETMDAAALGRLLADDPALANGLISWGEDKGHRNLTHPLHYICDVLFADAAKKGRELDLVAALIDAGADVNFQSAPRTDTPLIGAASLGAEDVGLALLRAGARADLVGIFGETALHWAAHLGEARLAAGLIHAPIWASKTKNSPELHWTGRCTAGAIRRLGARGSTGK